MSINEQLNAPYDQNNVFAKILAGEIPNNTVYEDEVFLAFHDIAPATPVHIVIIPKVSGLRSPRDLENNPELAGQLVSVRPR